MTTRASRAGVGSGGMVSPGAPTLESSAHADPGSPPGMEWGTRRCCLRGMEEAVDGGDPRQPSVDGGGPGSSASSMLISRMGPRPPSADGGER
jgi:hypothetical protein